MSYEVLKYDAQYFKNHNEHWDRVSEDLDAVRSLALDAKAGDGALWTTLVPGFKQVHDQICDLIIESLLARGVTHTRTIGDKLETTCRQYLAAEAENTATANQILQEVGY